MEPREDLPTDSNKLLEERLDSRALSLEEITGGHVIHIKAVMMAPIDDIVRDSIEKRRSESSKHAAVDKITVVLETNGGHMEPVRRIAETLHHHYKLVEYIVPNYAMSAGTVLVMSGDAIYMDYYSVIGPIDPQFRREGQLVPGVGYIEKYNEFMDRASKEGLNDAELTYLIQKFDPGFLHQIEHELEMSVEYLKEWLVKYKFKNWEKTETRKLDVTPEMKEDRAAQIAETLNSTKTWHSHSRGIPMRLAQDVLNLQIEVFGENDDLKCRVREYHGLVVDYAARRGIQESVHRPGKYIGFS